MWDAFNFYDWDYNKDLQKDDPSGKNKKKVLQGTTGDYLFKLYLTIGAVHYLFDSFVKIYYFGFGIIYEGCSFWYFIHHVNTVINFKSLWMLDHYPWFMLLPPSYHCVMVAWPKLWINNYVYGVAITCYIGFSLIPKTFRENRVHRALGLKFFLLAIPIINMGRWECA